MTAAISVDSATIRDSSYQISVVKLLATHSCKDCYNPRREGLWIRDMPFQIDLDETFENLPRAPIVEAVIHWRARAGTQVERQDLQNRLRQRLPEYPKIQMQHEVEMQLRRDAGGSTSQSHRVNWQGFRCESEDGRYIAQFKRDGFVFSRLKPYENWDAFETEALRLWRIHCELAEPSQVERLGVRFINRVVPVSPDDLSNVVVAPPEIPRVLDLPSVDFLHQARLGIPNSDYQLNVVEALQPPNPESNSYGLLLDLDVSTSHAFELTDASMPTRLAEMRWIKNKAFFTLLAPTAIQQFRESV